MQKQDTWEDMLSSVLAVEIVGNSFIVTEGKAVYMATYEIRLVDLVLIE